jgi:hypothetical protein
MALNTPAIATAIAALSVSGVTMKDITGIPKAVKAADCPIFFPHPDDWMLGTQSVQDTQWVGQATVFDATRRFRYIYLHDVSIAANPISSIYAAMAAKVDLIYSAIATMNTSAGVLTVESISISQFGEIVAPAAGTSTIRNVFYGCFFEIQILEQSTS